MRFPMQKAKVPSEIVNRLQGFSTLSGSGGIYVFLDRFLSGSASVYPVGPDQNQHRSYALQKGKRFAEIEHSAHDGGNRSQSGKDGPSRCADDGDGVIGAEKGYNAAADSQIQDTDQKTGIVKRQRDILPQCSL